MKKYLKLPPAPFIPQKNTSLHENPVRDSPRYFSVSKLDLFLYISNNIFERIFESHPTLSRFMPKKNILARKSCEFLFY